MTNFLTRFLRRLACWWLPVAAPWCLLFLGAGPIEEIEIWYTEITPRRFFRAMADGLMFALPIALFATLAHTATMYRDAIFSPRADPNAGARAR
jgi:hypothetical protein